MGRKADCRPIVRLPKRLCQACRRVGSVRAGADVSFRRLTVPPYPPKLERCSGRLFRALLARHYTRDRGGHSEVCSVEIWAFEDAKRLASARAHLERPGWRYHQEGSLLVMLRGVRFQRERGFQKGLFPDCERLGERIRARVAARTR